MGVYIIVLHDCTAAGLFFFILSFRFVAAFGHRRRVFLIGWQLRFRRRYLNMDIVWFSGGGGGGGGGGGAWRALLLPRPRLFLVGGGRRSYDAGGISPAVVVVVVVVRAVVVAVVVIVVGMVVVGGMVVVVVVVVVAVLRTYRVRRPDLVLQRRAAERERVECDVGFVVPRELDVLRGEMGRRGVLRAAQGRTDLPVEGGVVVAAHGMIKVEEEGVEVVVVGAVGVVEAFEVFHEGKELGWHVFDEVRGVVFDFHLPYLIFVF